MQESQKIFSQFQKTKEDYIKALQEIEKAIIIEFSTVETLQKPKDPILNALYDYLQQEYMNLQGRVKGIIETLENGHVPEKLELSNDIESFSKNLRYFKIKTGQLDVEELGKINNMYLDENSDTYKLLVLYADMRRLKTTKLSITDLTDISLGKLSGNGLVKEDKGFVRIRTRGWNLLRETYGIKGLETLIMY